MHSIFYCANKINSFIHSILNWHCTKPIIIITAESSLYFGPKRHALCLSIIILPTNGIHIFFPIEHDCSRLQGLYSTMTNSTPCQNQYVAGWRPLLVVLQCSPEYNRLSFNGTLIIKDSEAYQTQRKFVNLIFTSSFSLTAVKTTRKRILWSKISHIFVSSFRPNMYAPV